MNTNLGSIGYVLVGLYVLSSRIMLIIRGLQWLLSSDGAPLSVFERGGLRD